MRLREVKTSLIKQRNKLVRIYTILSSKENFVRNESNKNQENMLNSGNKTNNTKTSGLMQGLGSGLAGIGAGLLGSGLNSLIYGSPMQQQRDLHNLQLQGAKDLANHEMQNPLS